MRAALSDLCGVQRQHWCQSQQTPRIGAAMHDMQHWKQFAAGCGLCGAIWVAAVLRSPNAHCCHCCPCAQPPSAAYL